MLFIAGMSFAPTMVVVMNLGTFIVPPSKITEGLTWMTMGISIGVALGSVLAGMVIDVYGAQTGFSVTIVSGLAMVVIVLLGLNTLRVTSEA
ncbi:Major facilitator superfamily MFS_1 (fragment) [Xenorhabdus innexi]|uniref:MFS transporter n=2 Tax=Xenorhabdus innexi TaxID=290109 RepID=A0A1N6MSX2_9GAMM